MPAGDAGECLMDAGNVDIEGARFVEPRTDPVMTHQRDETEHLGGVYRTGPRGRGLVIEQLRAGVIRHPDKPSWGEKRGVGGVRRRFVEERLAGHAQRPRALSSVAGDVHGSRSPGGVMRQVALHFEQRDRAVGSEMGGG
jgi:hypothetical protein